MPISQKKLIMGVGACVCLAHAATSIQIDAHAEKKAISPYIYGKNASFAELSDNPSSPTSAQSIQFLKDVGVKILRTNDGNNSTKYNWKKKISSHPDWYNNVYPHDWDFKAKELQTKLPGVQGLFGLQMLGWVADNSDHNYNDVTNYPNQAGKYWPGVCQDLAGGGESAISGTEVNGNIDWCTATKKGDPSLYLREMGPDEVTDILPYWFGKEPGQLGLDPSTLRYWNMDNEPELWGHTHNDITSGTTIDEYINKYITLATHARNKFPEIQIVGPSFANEWYWWTWNNKAITESGIQYTPIQYFLKKIAAAEKSSGKKLIDVFGIHSYPGYNSPSDMENMLQYHRSFFDRTYNDPKANGIHVYYNSWYNTDLSWGTPVPTYIFGRISDWMEEYLGKGRSRLAMTEFGSINLQNSGECYNTSACAVEYASILGTFADYGVEIFTPWSWYDGFFETLHLFTSYTKSHHIASQSSNDSLVSAYTSTNTAGDSITVVLVNRDTESSQIVHVVLSNFNPVNRSAPTYELSNLKGETFLSKQNNALVSRNVDVSNTGFTMTLPSLSVTAVILHSNTPSTTHSQHFENRVPEFRVQMNQQRLTVQLKQPSHQTIQLIDGSGKRKAQWDLQPEKLTHEFAVNHLAPGIYWIKILGQNQPAISVVKLP